MTTRSRLSLGKILAGMVLLGSMALGTTAQAVASHPAYVPDTTHPGRASAGTPRVTPLPIPAATAVSPAVTPMPQPLGTPDGQARFYDRRGEAQDVPFATLGDLERELGRLASPAAAETFWKRIDRLDQMPLIFDDSAVFLYRGTAKSVAWIGDFTTWRSGKPLVGERIAKTDIWWTQQRFPRDARFDYKILLDGRQILDPLNPVTQLGGYGPNSVLMMPRYQSPSHTVARAGTRRGTLSAPKTLDSKYLGYAKRFTVYTPAGSASLRNLPVLYVTDGHEFSHPEMGALPVILDNLIADGRISPVIAVFIDPRSTTTGDNRRGPELLTNPHFQSFLTRELIPFVDGQYATRPLAESRAIVGVSLGGLHATYTAMRQPDWFGNIAILSPYLKEKPAVLAEVEKSPRQPLRLFVSQGTYDFDVMNTRRLGDALAAKGYSFMYMETNDGHSWGNWRGVLDDMLLYFFAA